MARQSYQHAFGEASVAAGAWTAVATLTPDADSVVVGVNCDMASILTTSYRYRVTLDGAVVVQEMITTTANSWIPLTIGVPAGSALAVELIHSEASAQDATATICARQPGWS